MVGLGVFSPKRIVLGLVITTFIITPTIFAPEEAIVWSVNFIGKISPIFSDIAGRLI